MVDLSYKKAIVTGGSRGIGAAIAKRLAKDGAEVVLTYNSSPDKSKLVVEEIVKAGGKAHALQLDGNKPEDAKALIDAAVKLLGGLDILVNNAGVGKEGNISDPDYNLAGFDEVFNVNVRTVFAVTHAAVPYMKAGGRIINISSCLGERAIAKDCSIYNASKFAVNGLTRSWAHDLGVKNITVNAVLPGPIDTDMNPANVGSGMENLTVLKRYGEAHEVANVVAFLASDESSYMTGATINVDGGTNT